MNISLSPFAPENLVSRDGFGSPIPRQPAHLHAQAESGAYLRNSSRFPRVTGGMSLLSPPRGPRLGHASPCVVLARCVHLHRVTFFFENNMCVCVFFPFILDQQVRWTYRAGSHRIYHPPSFCGACLNVAREKDSAIHFPRRP